MRFPQQSGRITKNNEPPRRKQRGISWIVDYINAASRGEYDPERFKFIIITIYFI
jgi:hypothetical protein